MTGSRNTERHSCEFTYVALFSFVWAEPIPRELFQALAKLEDQLDDRLQNIAIQFWAGRIYGMKVISIDAPCNGSGKTSLILSILSAFPNRFAFTKFTTIYGDEQFCPAKDHDCACHRLRGDYNICTDADVLSKPDTDTGKVWRGGALQTL